jgi:hypothetical protein
MNRSVKLCIFLTFVSLTFSWNGSSFFVQETYEDGTNVKNIRQIRTKSVLKEKKLLPSQKYGVYPDSNLVYRLQNIDISTLLSEDRIQRDSVKPFRIGKGIDILVSPCDFGSIFNVENNKVICFVQICSPGALGIRVHFKNFELSPGDQVFMYPSSNPDNFSGPFENLGPLENGDFWSPTIKGDKIVIEMFCPSSFDRNRQFFQIEKIVHLYFDPLTPATQVGACNNDLSCFQDWADAGKAVGLMSFIENGNSYVCTGACCGKVIISALGNVNISAILG